MVRRWSYINEINRTVFVENSAVPRARHEMTVRVNLYYKKSFSAITLVRRRSWVKRRHVSTFAIYRNVLADWSGDYIFYRKYSKFRFFYQLFREAFWAQNFISIRNLVPGHYKNFEKVYTTTFIKTVFNYCTLRGSNRFKYLGNFSHTLWLHVTSPKLAAVFNAQTNDTYALMYRDSNAQLAHPKLKLKSNFIYQQLISTIHSLYMVKLLELYKIMTLLTLTNTL